MPTQRPNALTASLSDTVFGSKANETQRPKQPNQDQAPVWSLHVGDMWTEPVEEARPMALQAFAADPRFHRYAPVGGLPEMKEAFRASMHRRHGIDLPPPCIQISAGATAGLAALCQSLLSPGDEVLLPVPHWPLIRGMIVSQGAVPVELPVFAQADHDAFAALVDPDALRDMLQSRCSPRTVAIYLNTPHNPTGAVLSQRHLDVVAEVAAAHDLWVICDEAYDALWFTEEAPPCAWMHEGLQARSIVCHTMSKCYAMASARVGILHGPAPAIELLRAVQTFHHYCASTPFQWLAARALDHGDEWLRSTREHVANAAQHAANAVNVPVPAGGTFLFFPQHLLPASGHAEQTPLEAAGQRGVLLTPGSACGTDFAQWARLCFTSLPPDALDQALRALMQR